MQHGRLKFKNAANIMQHERVYLPMSQMPCKMRGSISTMQVGVAECWKYNSTYRTNSVVCFSAFLALMVSPVFFFLALKSFTGFLTSWLCLRSPVHCNQSHKRTEITSTAYTQTKTTTSTVVGVPPATPPPTTTTTATATTKAATTTTTTTTTTT